MKRDVLIAAAALACACNRSPATSPPQPDRPADTSAEPAAEPTKAASFDLKDDLVDFHFGWSAEVSAVPELVSKLTADKDRIQAELTKGAAEERAARNREKYGLTFNGFQSSTDYRTLGQSRRLLSLAVDTGAYTGGAHPNHGTSALLWDRDRRRKINNKDLFGQPANRERLLTQRWCDALNKARKEKRGEPVGGGGMFDECPSLDEIAVMPADKDRDGHFETLVLHASPYVAGPYAEGDYEVELPVTGDLMAVLKAEYRPSFAAQPPQ